jgi:hypothetical protein
MGIRKFLEMGAVLLLILGFGFSLKTLPQKAEIDLKDQELLNVNITTRNILLALSHLSEQQKIPIGLEFAMSNTVQTNREIHFSAAKSSLSQVLDEITSQDGRFIWRSSGQVIHVLPKGIHRDTCIERLLSLPVDNFAAEKGSTYLGLRSKLYSLPGFHEGISACGLEIDQSVIPSQDFSIVLRKSSLILRGTTFSGILDRIITKSDSKFWVLNRTGDNGRFLFVNF